MDVREPEEQVGLLLEVHEYITVHEATGAVVVLLMNGGCGSEEGIKYMYI